MTSEREEALNLAREAGFVENPLGQYHAQAPKTDCSDELVKFYRLAKQRGAEEQKRKIQDCPAVTLLLEACDYGQFSADFDQPQAKPVRAAILEVCKMLRDIGAIEEQP